MKRILTLTLAAFVISGASWAQTPNPFPTPPSPAAPRTVTVPTTTDTRLSNGLRVIIVPRPGSGLVAAQLILPSAAAIYDGGTGVAQATANLLTKGTKTRTATQIADAVEQVGATLSAGATYDATIVSLSVLKTRLNDVMPIFADVVQNPRFAPEEVERYKAQTTDEVAVALKRPGTLARFVSARVLYGDAAYGKMITGTPATLKRIKPADVAAFYRRGVSPLAAILILTGDISANEAQAVAEKYFGTWKPQLDGADGYANVAPPPAKQRRIVIIDASDSGQSAVFVSRMGTKQSDPEPVIAELANDILGGGYSSRLGREVRIKRGLSYGASSRLDARTYEGVLTLATQTKHETAGEAARVLVDELAGLSTNAPTVDELAARKSALSGDFARALETGEGLTGLVAGLALYNQPLSRLQTYLSDVQAVTPEQVTAVAKARFAANVANVVIVGDAKAFLPDLKRRFPGETVEVIPVAALNLDSPTLRKQ